MPEFGCVSALCYIKPPHKCEFDAFYKFSTCSMWIREAQVLFKIKYAPIPKNYKLFGMPHISNVLEKNRFVDSEDTWTMKDNSKKKDLGFILQRLVQVQVRD